MPDRSPHLNALVHNVEIAAAKHTDPLAALVTQMRAVIHSAADPYLLVGALIECVASTVVQRVPFEKQGEVSIETVRLLRDRLRHYGAI